MDHILRELKERFSGDVKLEEGKVQFLLFADDLMLVAEKEEDVKANLWILDDVMAKRQMKTNWEKESDCSTVLPPISINRPVACKRRNVNWLMKSHPDYCLAHIFVWKNTTTSVLSRCSAHCASRTISETI